MDADAEKILLKMYRRVHFLQNHLNAGHYGDVYGEERLPPYDQMVGAIHELNRLITESEKELKRLPDDDWDPRVKSSH